MYLEMLRELGFGLELLSADDALERPQHRRRNVVLRTGNDEMRLDSTKNVSAVLEQRAANQI